jgi:GNAT superfamily N-acetyltransferase
MERPAAGPLHPYEPLPGRDAVLAAAGFQPYARLTGTGEVTGYRGPDLLAWVGIGPWGPIVCALGEPDAALAFAVAVRAAGADQGAGWMHLPRVPAAGTAALPVTLQDDWDFLSATAPPPAVSGEDLVEPLDPDADPAIGDLLDAAFPTTTSRPGDPRVRRWYGVRDGDRIVAAGADRSRGGVGFLAGLAVHPEHRRRGLGAALTARMTRDLHAEFGIVTLGVMCTETGPRRLYERLGYGDPLPRSSLRLDPAQGTRSR